MSASNPGCRRPTCCPSSPVRLKPLVPDLSSSHSRSPPPDASRPAVGVGAWEPELQGGLSEQPLRTSLELILHGASRARVREPLSLSARRGWLEKAGRARRVPHGAAPASVLRLLVPAPKGGRPSFALRESKP